jgi:hypothetical protein
MSRARTAAIAALLLAITLAAGCYRTSVTVQGGGGTVPMAYDAKWHHGAVWGLVDISSPHNLNEICPGGTATIYTKTSFLNGLVQAITFSLYNPQEVTITCSGGGGAAPAAAPEAAPLEAAPEAEPAAEPAPEADDLPPPPPDPAATES